MDIQQGEYQLLVLIHWEDSAGTVYAVAVMKVFWLLSPTGYVTNPLITRAPLLRTNNNARVFGRLELSTLTRNIRY